MIIKTNERIAYTGELTVGDLKVTAEVQTTVAGELISVVGGRITPTAEPKDIGYFSKQGDNVSVNLSGAGGVTLSEASAAVDEFINQIQNV